MSRTIRHIKQWGRAKKPVYKRTQVPVELEF
jgi:hypothetical protein